MQWGYAITDSRWGGWGLFGLLLGLSPQWAWAMTQSVTLDVKVTVLTATCTVSSTLGNNQPITIDFNDIVANKVDGVAYARNIPYALTCSNASENPALTLSLSGDPAKFNANLLSTVEEEQLGISFKVGNSKSALNLGQTFSFKYAQRPSLWAVPQIGDKKKLRGGKFTASATLTIDYE